MTGSSQGEQGCVRIEMALPAPIEDVYAAWTQPEAMARWLAPMGSAEVEADVRVGGRFRVVMIGDGMSIQHTGEYLTVEPPRRPSFTWQSPTRVPSQARKSGSRKKGGANECRRPQRH